MYQIQCWTDSSLKKHDPKSTNMSSPFSFIMFFTLDQQVPSTFVKLFSPHISPVLCLLALFWTQEQRVWNKLVSDTISPITSSGLLRPPKMSFWLQKSQCLATVYKRTLCQPGILDAVLELILTPLASAGLQLYIFLLAFPRNTTWLNFIFHRVVYFLISSSCSFSIWQ